MNITMSPNYIPKVSVIVPVYNTERYVERAIISLMEQTLDDVQFIIIDDGSKDNSLNIIKQVIARYPARQGQVTLISRENRGVAATRAQGMELATGDYVIHLDSDDWAELNWLEALYTKAIEENADVVVCDYYAVFKNRQVPFKQDVPDNNIECIKRLLAAKISNSNCDKLVRRSIFEREKINFHIGYDMGEDFLITFLVLLNSQKVVSLDATLYFYNKTNDNSLTRKYDGKAFSSLFNITQIIEGELQSKELLSKMAYDVDMFKLNTVSLYIINSSASSIDIKYAFGLYPMANKIIMSTNMKLLKSFYFCHRLGFSSLCKYILAVWKVLNKRFI
jgi:glycosyltransferase involved in cell wall biosynthesis